MPSRGRQMKRQRRVILTFDLLNPEVDHCIPPAPWTTCANLQQIQFIRFQNFMFRSLVADRRTDGRTDGPARNIMLPASLN